MPVITIKKFDNLIQLIKKYITMPDIEDANKILKNDLNGKFQIKNFRDIKIMSINKNR